MNQNRLKTDGQNGGAIDTPEATTNESVSGEYEALTLCPLKRVEAHTFETHSALHNSVDRLVVAVGEVTEVDFATRFIEYERP